MDYKQALEQEKAQNVSLLKVIHKLNAELNKKSNKVYKLNIENKQLRDKCDLYYSNCLEQNRMNKQLIKKVYA